MSPLISPAEYTILGFPLKLLAILIPVVGISFFSYVVNQRLALLKKAASDPRVGEGKARMHNVLSLWLMQARQLRYTSAGIIHIVIFFGFLIVSIKAISLVFLGINEDFFIPGLEGTVGHIYNFFKDIAATMILIAALAAIYRRKVIKPKRYAVPEGKAKDHSAEAVLVLVFIALLMLSESFFEGSMVAAGGGESLTPLTLPWLAAHLLTGFSPGFLQFIHLISYYIHDVVFFVFLCYLPFGKHFHVVTSLFNVWFMRLTKGRIKPVRYGLSQEQLFDLESFGVKKMEEFTWKHILDFYSCADCGRCADNCPANTVGRPLSPRFLSVKSRDRIIEATPLKSGETSTLLDEPLVGSIYHEDELWSCTTCGACEEECPIGIEYIDKIVDLRRGMVDEGMVPTSLQAPLKALEKRGNPYGKMEKKRAEWTKAEGFAEGCQVQVLDNGGEVETLYFVDSISSYEDRMQEIARATSRILQAGGENFGVLGKKEKDSGNDVRRFGEEMLFQDLMNQNRQAIAECGAKQVITADPHAMNTLKNEYEVMVPVKHISEYALDAVKSGRIHLQAVGDAGRVYTYHDPCYLGRHNGVYDTPRELMDAIPGVTRVEMERNEDRSFCCGGGGLMLYYEPEEETRMGLVRVKMAKETGANVIVTACPFCLVNIQDAVKTLDLDKEIEVVDLAELVAKHLA
jgi:Fe-S oxidoreductase